MFAFSHFCFHLLHFEGFTVGQASLVGAVPGFEVVLALILLAVARRNRDAL